MIRLYGIKNCDAVRKARKWLDRHDIEYAFHDFREDGLDQARVQAWIDALGWENLINRRGATWRALPDADKENVNDVLAAALILAHPALIKRPLLEWQGQLRTGFTEAAYQDIFA